MESELYLTRAALGQIASIGSIYDCRSDNFIGAKIFKKEIPKSALTLVDNPSFDVKYINSDNFSEKFTKLDVSAELQVSVLGGLLSLTGSGKYLKEEKKSLKSVQLSLLYNICTKEENVNIYDEELKDCFSLDALNSGTHVVVGISWGSNSLVSCTYKMLENEDRQDIEGSLGASMKKIAFSISGKGSVDVKEGDKEKEKSFEIRIFGDILPQNEELPQNYESAIDLIKKMPQLVKSSNDGKGKPLKYTLISIKEIAKYLSFELKTDLLINCINESSLIRVVNIFEEISRARQKLNDQLELMEKFDFCISTDELGNIRKLKENFIVTEADFKSKLSATLVQVRGGKSNAKELESILSEYLQNDSSPEKVQSYILKNLKEISEKISFAEIVCQNKITYIGHGSSLDALLLKNIGLEIYVFYFKLLDKGNDTNWEQNRDLFFNEFFNKNQDSNSLFVAVDCDAHQSLYPEIGHNIQITKNGKIICDNLLAKMLKFQNISIARCTEGFNNIVYPTNKRSYVEIPCPGDECNPQDDHKWLCTKCEKFFEYGYDGYFYCSCGRGVMNNFEFKCSSQAHGLNFNKFTNRKYFKELLSKLTPFQEMNILILGETGVGKSTWINGFLNYLSFESLAEAEKHELRALIHSEFAVMNDDFKQVIVKTGVSEGEVHMTGQSATQKTKMYQFQVGNVKVRLIDTPGVGDVRGIKQDQINFQNILSTLSDLENLHGICILLKPNDSRLTVMFRFCINELLTHLHRDASQNIVFCFTNSRATLYEPGDTFAPLQKLLSENKGVEIALSRHTVYCFDSESFRFLAILKARAKSFNENDRKNFEGSWEKSKCETERLLKHIQSLKPHPISSTLSLNNARTLIIKLTKPIAEITKNILTNIELNKDQRLAFEQSKKSAKDFEKDLYMDRLDLEATPIDYPKTVCKDSSCTEEIGIGEGGLTKTNYKTICHDHCYLKGVDAENVGHPDLINCSAMNSSGHCNICGHLWRVHLHIRYNITQVNVRIIDKNVQDIIDQKLSVADSKRQMIVLLEKTKKEYERELEKIEETSAKFGCFLKANAITAYNDALLDYLDMLINQENDNIAKGGRKDIREGLISMRTGYKQQFERLDEEIKRGGSNSTNKLTPADIDRMMKELYNLKHFGANIQMAMDVSGASSTKAVQSNKEIRSYQNIIGHLQHEQRVGKKWYQFW